MTVLRQYRLVLTFGQHEYTSTMAQAKSPRHALELFGFYPGSDIDKHASRLEVEGFTGFHFIEPDELDAA